MELSKNHLLLSTKLKIPAPRKNYIIRTELFKKLEQAEDMSVVFICGAAGTGKTTLLSSYIKEKKLENLCWLTLDPSIAHISSFWLYFSSAVSSFLDDNEELLEFLNLNYDIQHMENFIIMLINKICSEKDYYMVLDDIHYLTDKKIIQTFEFFLKSIPENFHLIMLSREEPSFYLGEMAVSGRLLYISNTQMSLSRQDEYNFLTQTLGLEQKSSVLEKYMEYAEGWIGGLQLAVAANTMNSKSKPLLKAGGGIATEYLNREIFHSLLDEEKEFLIRTGFLSYFNFSVCSVLFQNMTKRHYHEILQELEQKNLFIICLDEDLEIYRYHNILMDFLRNEFNQLPQEIQIEYYEKAASCFETQQDNEEALRLWYNCKAYKEVLRLSKSMAGQMEIYKYLDQIPLEILTEEPELLAQCFIFNVASFHLEKSKLVFQMFKEHYSQTDLFKAIRFAEVYVDENSNAIPQYEVLHAEQIDKLKLGTVMKAILLVENATALMNRMEYEEANNCITKALAITSSSNTYANFFAINQLAQIHEETGDLEKSLACYEKGTKILKSSSFSLGMEANYYFGLMGVYIRQMNLKKAEEIIEMIHQLIQDKHLNHSITNMTLDYHKAELLLISGKDEQAKNAILKLMDIYQEFNILTLNRLFYELDCRNLLSVDLANTILKEIKKEPEYTKHPIFKLLHARIHFLLGEGNEAMKEIDELLAFSRKKHNKLKVIEAGVFKINLLLKTKAPTPSREIMNLFLETIHYAYHDTIKQPFYLERESLIPLFEQAQQQYKKDKNLFSSKEGQFFRELIPLCCGENEKPELLSMREMEVMKELALGITNKEIADRLCISQATVKTHVLNIYGKLKVSSRMKAVEKARAIGLL